jgi:hypothetical protein
LFFGRKHQSKACVILLKLCTIALTMCCQIELHEGYLMPLIIFSQIKCIVVDALKALPNFKIYNTGKAPKAKGFPKVKALGCQG